MEVVSGDNWTTGAISRAKLQSNHHHQQTNTQFFYRPDALPVAQPTVSKHWAENITNITKLEDPTGGLELTWSSKWEYTPFVVGTRLFRVPGSFPGWRRTSCAVPWSPECWFPAISNTCIHAFISNWKKSAQRWRKYCALAVVRPSQIFLPHYRPPSQGAGRPKSNHLEKVITFTYRPSLVRIDACNFELSR